MFFMEGKEIGKIINYFDHVGVAAIQLTGGIKLGDTIRIVGGDSDFTEVIDSIQVEGKNVESAKKGEGIGVKISAKARKGYKVFLVK